MIELYATDYCPFCTVVKEALEELELDFTVVSVPSPQHLRTEVKELSGQSLVPVIVDGENVVNDSRRIIQYLKSKYSIIN
ncbi:MAG: glutathione S-transferase N-terminal domain-containing protein [Candidatus Marinimicrobia bacterium]|nr:glutathione S-transferase N-terminal domain-containing protein [Candidatus Neomarinimicrobiota bacterium]